MFKSDPNSWDTSLLFTNALTWSKQGVRPYVHQLPQTIYFSPDFSKVLKDLQWATEHDGAAHAHGLYGCGPDYFYSQMFSGVRGPLFSYYPTITYANEADPYSWKNYVKVVLSDGKEIFRKNLERSRAKEYERMFPLARIVAAPPTLDPVTKKAIHSFFTIGEIKHCCFQTYRFMNFLITDRIWLIIATQETTLVNEVLTDTTIPTLKRLNTLHIVTYKGSIEEGKVSMMTAV